MGVVLDFRQHHGRPRRSKAGTFPSPRVVPPVQDDVPIVATSDDGHILLITDVQPDGTVTGLHMTPDQARRLAAELVVQAGRLEGA